MHVRGKRHSIRRRGRTAEHVVDRRKLIHTPQVPLGFTLTTRKPEGSTIARARFRDAMIELGQESSLRGVAVACVLTARAA